MTREQALAAAKALWGERGDTVALGRAFFIGIQRGRHEWDWRAVGSSWQEAVDNARANETARKAESKKIGERLGRVVVRLDGNTIKREWRGRTYVVTRVEDGWLYSGEKYSSLTAIAKVITNAKAINGRAWFGVGPRKEKAS
jgi:hypothetical protein